MAMASTPHGATSTDELLHRHLGVLSQLIEEENAALRKREFGGLAALLARKERALADLRRSAQAAGAAASSADVTDALAQMRERLAANVALLGASAQALRELASTVNAASCVEESDGTYRRASAGGWRAA